MTKLFISQDPKEHQVFSSFSVTCRSIILNIIEYRDTKGLLRRDSFVAKKLINGGIRGNNKDILLCICSSKVLFVHLQNSYLFP